MDRPSTPRIVKPRKAAIWFRHIIAVDDSGIFVERTGELYERSALSAITATEPSSMIISHHVGILVKELDDVYSHLASWNFRATPVEREVWKPNRERKTVVRNTVINFFGFPGRYHYPVDPLLFSKVSVHELIPDDRPTLAKLFQWGDDLRAWLMEQQLPQKPTHGGIAALLLKDPRFYPEARRKIPRATNDRARTYLPGNYYRLRVPTWREYDAIYLDQSNSHHNCAKAIDLPASDRLYGSGRFRDPLAAQAKPYAKAGTRLYRDVLSRYGLLYLELINPEFGPDAFPLPVQEQPGRVRAFVYSNELPYLRETGTIIESVVAAWTSDTKDTGIPAFAEWSLKELADHPDYRLWLKPALLAPYGILAAVPRRTEVGHRRAKGGEDRQYPVGGSLIPVKSHRAKRESEATIANVIQRGMIEAETRLRSLRMATHMQAHGFPVLAVYADSVFVEALATTLPFLLEGWKVEASLTRLRFYNDVSFSSEQVTKLPGISREDRERLQLVRRISSGTEVTAETVAAKEARRMAEITGVPVIGKSY